MAEVAPSTPAADSSRPTRRALFLRGLVDVLLFSLPMLVALVGFIILLARGSGRDLVSRKDRWRFETMPASEDALLAWSRSQGDLRNVRVQRFQGDHELLLRYERSRAKGPAHPDWDLLGYRMAYLVSAPSLQIPVGMSLWLGLIAAYLAGGGLAVFRIRRGLRAGVPLISPADRPQRGWLRWVLLACVMVVALDGAETWLLRILHLEQEMQRSVSEVLRLTTGSTLLIAVAALVLVAPIVEELLFRGCVFGRFEAYRYGVSGAIVSALMFAVVHGVLALLPFYFGVGIILAWLCHRTHSLWPSMALHCLNNGIAVIAVFSATT
jgi:membrane protease YdiL (CAAX protease family)